MLYERFGVYLTEIATQQTLLLKTQVETFYILLNVYFIIIHTVVLVTFYCFYLKEMCIIQASDVD